MESYSYTSVQSRKESIQTDTFLRQSLKRVNPGDIATNSRVGSTKSRLRQNSYQQEDIFHMQTSYLLDPEIAEVREEGSVCDASCDTNDNAIMLYNRQYTSSHKIQQRLAVISWLIFLFCVLASILAIFDVEFAHSQSWITTSEAFHHAQANITEGK